MNYVYNNNWSSPAGLAGAVHDYQITAFLFMILFNLVNIPHRFNQLILCLPCFRRFAIRYNLRT